MDNQKKWHKPIVFVQNRQIIHAVKNILIDLDCKSWIKIINNFVFYLLMSNTDSVMYKSLSNDKQITIIRHHSTLFNVI